MYTLNARIQDDRLRSLLLMQSTTSWPTWPFLPLIRQRPDGSRQLGVLYDARQTSGQMGFSATVFLHNLFALPLTEASLLSGPKCVYDTLEELLQDGWRAD